MAPTPMLTGRRLTGSEALHCNSCRMRVTILPPPTPSKVALPANSSFCHAVAFEDGDPDERWGDIKSGKHSQLVVRQSPANAGLPKWGDCRSVRA